MKRAIPRKVAPEETHLYIKVVQNNRTLEFSYDFDDDVLQDFLNAFYDTLTGIGYHPDTLSNRGLEYN